jgi:hypothetical protein
MARIGSAHVRVEQIIGERNVYDHFAHGLARLQGKEPPEIKISNVRWGQIKPPFVETIFARSTRIKPMKRRAVKNDY